MHYAEMLKTYLTKCYETHNKDMFAAIIWMHKNQVRLPDGVIQANRHLSVEEKNGIIRDILYPF